MTDPQIEIIKEIFPEEFHPNSQEILRLKNDIEDSETRNSELASFICSKGDDLWLVLAEHFREICKNYKKTSFWMAVHESSRRESNPLDRFLARWREHGWKGYDGKIENDEESYKRKWENYKNDISTRPNNAIIPSDIVTVIEKWSDFPLDEFYSIVEDYPKDVVLFSRSKRLSAIIALNPEPLRNILKKRPEALHHLALSRLFSPMNSFLDLSTVVRGDDDFIVFALNTPSSVSSFTIVKVLAAIGTQRALHYVQDELRKLHSTPYSTPGFESNFSLKILAILHLNRLPEDRPWLAEYLVKDQELLTEALELVADDRATQWHGNAEDWLSLIHCEALLPLAMALYVSDPSCSDSLWRNTVKRLLPDVDVVSLTAKLADSLPSKTKKQIIEAQLRLELGNLLDSGKLEKAEATIRFALTVLPDFFDELGLELTPSGIKLTQSLTHLLNITIDIWTWLNGELVQGQTAHNVKGIVSFLHKRLNSFHDYQPEPNNAQLFSTLHAVDRNKYFDAIKNRLKQRLVEPDKDSSLVEQLILASKERILVKISKYAPESAAEITVYLGDEYPNRFRLEQVLTKKLSWPVAEDDNETSKLLDRLDDDTLPGLLRECQSALVHSHEDLWHRYCNLATFLREVYPDYPQAWVRAIVPLLDKDKYKDLHPEWIRALVICLGFLREPWGNKVPQLLRSMANDPSLGDLCEDIKTQAAQFNRENFNKGHHRLERRRVDDVKRYLARTSRLVGRKHKQ